MNFQTLQKVENPDFYINVAFKAATDRAGVAREKKSRHKIDKSKFIEIEKVLIIESSLCKQLNTVLKCFPSIDQLDPFYLELIKTTIDYAKLKKSLGALNWCVKKVHDFSALTLKKIRTSAEIDHVNAHRRSYYGRTASLVKQIKKELVFLDEARKIMKGYPSIKTGCTTVCIAGFPNVGKSTLLSKITDASPEIDDYAFTTKTLNLGYWKLPTKRIQFIDTPGTLDRLDKMNVIEKQAYLAIKHVADILVYVFDLTEQAGDIKIQKKLFLNLRKFNKPIIVYFSKADLLNKDAINNFSIKGFSDPEQLKEEILKSLKQ